METLKYRMFDGERIFDGASVSIEDGRIAAIAPCAPEECGDGFLMPGLIDAHTHMESLAQADRMIESGILTTFDVNGSRALIESSERLHIVSSAGMAMGLVMNPRGFVEKMAANGARYIKVLLFNPHSVGRKALNGIVSAAHERNLKVAVHATELETVWQAADAGADVLLHVPMKEKYPAELAEMLAEKGIAAAPTLVMMETFSKSGRNGYLPEHFENALSAVNLLYESGVKILTATDANSGFFAPAVDFGPTLHREMKLLTRCGIPPLEVLSGATGGAADAFGVGETGRIREGARADLLLIGGQPDQDISDMKKIRKMWASGREIR